MKIRHFRNTGLLGHGVGKQGVQGRTKAIIVVREGEGGGERERENLFIQLTPEFTIRKPGMQLLKY